MNETTNLNDNELLERIENCSLNPILFTHKTMLRLSWILIKKYGIDDAIEKNIELKENYFKTVFHSDKFNRTLTKAYTEILYFFMQKSKKANFEKLLREFPRLQYNFKSLVKTHYGFDILKEHRTEEPSFIDRPILFTF
jgi:meiotically up-regulated gene 157 (Mug157) protein